MTYRPSARIKRLRERMLAQPEELFHGRAYCPYYYLEGWMAHEGEPLPTRNAYALANIIERMPARITDGELIAGEHGNPCYLIPFVPEIPSEWTQDIASHLTDEERERFLSWTEQLPPRWQAEPTPPEITLAQEHGVISVWGTDLNHSIRDYEKVLRLGFSGIRAEVEAHPHPGPNHLAWLRICDAATTLGTRHAEEARRLGLDEIAEVCERVPAEPARTFREAVQALWFAHMITCWEDGINANGIGRIDQFLRPYLERDLAEGRLDMDEAAELLAALWVKLYQAYDVQQMMIGGQKADGSDAVNPLSYLALDVTEGLGFVRCLSARLHRGSPREFVERCVDLVAQGGGIPFFFNDEALIPALVSKGIPIEDARDYAAIGCIEITIPGKASPHAVSHWINLAKCLELALNDGRDLLNDAQVGPKTGSLADFDSMDDVLAAYSKQLDYFAEWSVHGSNAAELAHRDQYRLPYLSLLTDDCVSDGLDIIEGGARYNYHSSAAMGIPNAADSLAALRTAVFEDGTVSREEMLRALRTNFEGLEDLRLYLKNRIPKYGNDEPLPDGYAAELARQYCEVLGRYRTPSGGGYHVHLFTFTLMLPMGQATGASPDGRLAGEPLAYSVSPVQGRDLEGLTAVINSLSRIPHHLVAASSSAILEAHPSLLEGSGKQAFTDLLIASVNLGVGQLQFNVVSAESLRAAQEDPERYGSLCVRVSGFSQQFCLLDRAMQDHIIARTKHRK
ncbi:MAG: hypothetical protein KBC96_10600 [Armatimonadetes bacterium]|nr:hypothetical protein [Armatimonadota bacterium]